MTKPRTTLATLTAILLAAGALHAQVSPVVGEGVVVSVNTPGNATAESWTLEWGATVSATRYEPDETETTCGQTYVAGQTYPMLMVTAPGATKTQAFIAWQPKSDQNAYPLLAQLESELTGLGGGPGTVNVIKTCDRVTLQWQVEDGAPRKADVTVNIFRDGSARGLFGYDVPLDQEISAGDLPRDAKYHSPNQQFYLMFEEDGNLVVRRASDEAFIWGTINVGAPVASAVKFEDGNLRLFDGGGEQIWSTELGSRPQARLYLGADGYLRILDGNGQELWKSTVTNIPS